MSRIRASRPSLALVLSAGALFIALGGVAYAVPRSSSSTASKFFEVPAEFNRQGSNRAVWRRIQLEQLHAQRTRLGDLRALRLALAGRIVRF